MRTLNIEASNNREIEDYVIIYNTLHINHTTIASFNSSAKHRAVFLSRQNGTFCREFVGKHAIPSEFFRTVRVIITVLSERDENTIKHRKIKLYRMTNQSLLQNDNWMINEVWPRCLIHYQSFGPYGVRNGRLKGR